MCHRYLLLCVVDYYLASSKRIVVLLTMLRTGFSGKKIVTPPPFEDINGIFQGRVKVVGIQGRKLRKKHGFPWGVNAKGWKIPGGHGKFDRKSGEVNFKKIDILNRGRGLQFFSGKAQYRLVICANVVRCWHMTYIIYFDFVLIYNHLFCTQTTRVSYQTSKCRYSKKRKITGKKGCHGNFALGF